MADGNNGVSLDTGYDSSLSSSVFLCEYGFVLIHYLRDEQQAHWWLQFKHTASSHEREQQQVSFPLEK
jgi:hypothetical protein